MRSAQVYRWQIPMDAGVVLRDRRLKTRDGLYVCLREGEREGWGEISPLPGFSQETWEDAQSVLLAWVNNWLAGDCEIPQMPSVAFGVSCALAELAETLPQAANYRAAPLCNGDPDDLILKLADMPGEKVAKVKVGLYEAVRDGMVVNLLLEAIPDLHLRLDANRAVAQLAEKTQKPVCSIQGVRVWGNHSNSMYPDITAATIAGTAATELVDEAWYNDYFLPTVATRGGAIIKARGKSSAASAASAAIDHMRDWWNGSDGRVVTMAVPSDGSYGIPEGIVCGMPVICTGNGNYEIVKDIEFTAAGRARLDKTVAELVKESETVAPLIAE